MNNQKSYSPDLVIQQALHQAGMVPSRYVRDDDSVLVVLEGRDLAALELHLVASGLEQISGLTTTIRSSSELSPAERVKLREVGTSVA